MGHLLLWLESLTAVLLLLAVGVAWAARRERSLLRLVLALTPVVLLAVPAAVLLYVTWHLEFELGVTASWFYWVLAWNVGLAVGAIALLRGGLRLEGEPPAPVGRQWPPLRLALAGGVAVLLFLSTFTIMDAGAKSQVAALRSEAGALVLAAAPTRIADRENAAVLYQEAFDALVPQEKLPPAWKEKHLNWLDAGKPLDAADPDLQAYLGRQAPALDLLRQASARPSCYFPREYGRLDTLLPELGQLRQGAHLLALDARYRAQRGETAQAVADVVAIHQTARHTSSDPLLISYLVAVAVDNQAREALNALLRSAAPKPEELAPLLKLDPIYFRPLLQRAFQMEQATALSTYSALAEGSASALDFGGAGADFNPISLAPAFWRLFLMPEDVASYREMLRRYIELAGRPYPAAPDAYPAGHSVNQVRGIIVRQLLPAFHRIGQTTAKADASRRLVPLAAAVANYRTAKGKYPAQLDDLVPEFLPYVPTDPYTGQPMKLAVKDAGVIVYSVGPDLKDDGGQEINMRKQPLEGDIAVRIGTDVPAK